MIVVVLSIGQLISANPNTLKAGFTAYFAERNSMLTGEEVWAWMIKNLTPLRVADITLEQFCENLNHHFKAQIKIPIPFSDFEVIFKSMAAVDMESLERVSTLTKFLDQNKDIQLLLVSHTNYSHFKQILASIDQKLPSYGVIDITNNWSKEAQVLFVPSMSSKKPEHIDTLHYAFAKLGINSITTVVSFLNTIQKLEGYPLFQYIPAESKLDANKMIEHLRTVQLAVKGEKDKSESSHGFSFS